MEHYKLGVVSFTEGHDGAKSNDFNAAHNIHDDKWQSDDQDSDGDARAQALGALTSPDISYVDLARQIVMCLH